MRIDQFGTSVGGRPLNSTEYRTIGAPHRFVQLKRINAAPERAVLVISIFSRSAYPDTRANPAIKKPASKKSTGILFICSNELRNEMNSVLAEERRKIAMNASQLLPFSVFFSDKSKPHRNGVRRKEIETASCELFRTNALIASADGMIRYMMNTRASAEATAYTQAVRVTVHATYDLTIFRMNLPPFQFTTRKRTYRVFTLFLTLRQGNYS